MSKRQITEEEILSEANQHSLENEYFINVE